MTAMTIGSWANGGMSATPTGLSPPQGIAADDVAALAPALAQLADDVDTERAAVGSAGAFDWESLAAQAFRRALAEQAGSLATVSADLRDAAWQVRTYANYLYAGLDCRPG